MADEKTSGYCRKCNQRVMVTRPGTNHVLHLLLTILTAGLWLIVWICCAIKVGGWRCPLCGSPAGRYGSPRQDADDAHRQCPHCAETIRAEATKCRFCQSDIKPVTTAAELARIKSEKKKDSIVGWSAIGLVIAIIVIWNLVTK